MKVRVLYFASLRERAGRAEADETVGPGTTAGKLWERIRARPEFEGATPRPGYAVNGRWSDGTHILEDGDQLGLLPPVSGG